MTHSKIETTSTCISLSVLFFSHSGLCGYSDLLDGLSWLTITKTHTHGVADAVVEHDFVIGRGSKYCGAPTRQCFATVKSFSRLPRDFGPVMRALQGTRHTSPRCERHNRYWVVNGVPHYLQVAPHHPPASVSSQSQTRSRRYVAFHLASCDTPHYIALLGNDRCASICDCA